MQSGQAKRAITGRSRCSIGIPLGAWEDFVGFEEERNFSFRIRQAVRSVNGVAVDAGCEIGADGSCGSFRWVGGAHDLAVAGDCIFAFENHDENRAGDHEVDEFFKEGAFFVDGVESFRLIFAQVEHFRGDDAKAFFFEVLDDVADHVLADGIGLDDRKSLFQSLGRGLGHEVLHNSN